MLDVEPRTESQSESGTVREIKRRMLGRRGCGNTSGIDDDTGMTRSEVETDLTRLFMMTHCDGDSGYYSVIYHTDQFKKPLMAFFF